jgi:hypothetical protein
MLPFLVTKKFGREDVPGRENDLIRCKDKATAEAFIHKQMENDQIFKTFATYYLYDDLDTLLSSVNSEHGFTDSARQSDESENSQGIGGNSQTFNPSPLNMVNKPAGMQSSFTDVVGDDDND